MAPNMGFEFDAETALVVVDVQNDFADPRGSLYVRGGESVVRRAAELMEEARQAGAAIICTQDWHPEVTPHFSDHGGPWPRHCVGGSWGAEFHRELGNCDAVVRKGQGPEDGYSGFGVRDLDTGQDRPTELHPLLRDRAIRRVVVIGLALDVCVRATALDSVRLGYETFVIRDATAAVNLTVGDDETACREMADAGVLVL